ncbi:MBL fold metallo-hydrolase [Marinimicrobium sp. C6131]|uniref:MBL fold metallo-hydrolase RNA specificity domain-containing protein n=1 Tax=Marinimicrobium sp. C6131 TaxID=3022676 RepID=UPI00223E7D99|nr:MBL fold metallo-hydrolase [Marinimicrobium sp. C6131]UZJ45316.1 MBL fold metallo-hydrolase [Marinimicrobium sp. C6131]
MDYPKFQHHGGADGVTGSCHRYIAGPDHAVLIDCGLFQGQDADHIDSLEQHQIHFDLSAVFALIITHVHIDHIGRLPYLMAAGFKGPIYCSEPSAKLLPLVIEDALKIGFTRDARLINQFLDTVNQQLKPLPYRQWHTILDDEQRKIRIKLQRAGHILGSAYVEVDQLDKPSGQSHRTVFSGDLGAPYAPLLPAPRSPYKADTLIIESTYGNRIHESRKDRRLKLKAAIEHALKNDGTVIIPAFSIGRTQELLYELEDLIYRGGETWQKMEIIVDSPLAAKFTQVYRELKPFWDAEAQKRLKAGRHPLSFDNLYTVNSHEEHLQTVDYLAKTGRPAIVLAASGMAAGGRVVNYLKAMLGDERHQVLFVGYQAHGTPGRTIQQYGPTHGWVELDGERRTIRAGVTTIGGYSAHADQNDLVHFVKRMKQWPSTIRLVHGDREARETLKEKYQALGESRHHHFNILLPTND